MWIVDDSPLEAELLRRALAPLFRVEVFYDGMSLIEALAREPAVDAVILDWQMPGMTGIEVCQFLRSRPDTQALPILIMTVHGETRDVVEGLAAGADDFLSKPYNGAELTARLTALVRSKREHDRALEAERAMRSLLMHLPEAIVTVDEGGQVKLVNVEATRMLGAREGDLLGRPIAEVLPGIALDAVASRPHDDLVPLADVKVGDRVFAPMLRNFALAASGGDVTISFRDVTAQRRREEWRLDMYSILAHDLRSPLAAVISKGELLLRGRRGPLPPDAAKDVRTMQQRVRDLLRMTDDFLELAQLESAELKLVLEEVDLAALARESIEQHRPLAEDRRITIDADLRAERVFVAADRRRLAQVFSNLLSNAIKFTPEGGKVTVNVDADGDHARVLVRDTGHGISPETIPTLFQRYARALDARHQVAGTGLGLMIVRQIVEAHGGTVGVESEITRGSTFWFALPRAAAGAARGAADEHDGEARASRASDG